MNGNAEFGIDDRVSFGPFTFYPARRMLLRDGVQQRIGSRALEILAFLVERAGDLVTKDEIIARAWPNIFVDQSNLKVNVAVLRKALKDNSAAPRYIATISGRGYRFVAPLATVSADRDEPAPRTPRFSAVTPPPISPTRLIGRTDDVRTISACLSQGGITTVLGPGGIGKTRVAIAATEGQQDRFPDGICFVDFATISDPSLATQRVLDALGHSTFGEATLAALCGFLKEGRILILLDNCEHVIDAAARIAAAIAAECAGTHVVATSREALRVPGEKLHWLSDMGTPPAEGGLTAVQALTFPAIQLFVERVAACLGDYQLRESDVQAVRQICAALDGNPLAIELAASRTPSFGVHGLVPLLADRFALLVDGSRTVHGRQRTLLATMNWSYRLLPVAHQALLARLAVFPGPFTLEAAVEVAAFGLLDRRNVMLGLPDLVTHSLITRLAGEAAQFKLLETTRAFAMERLNERGEIATCSRILARYIPQELAEAERAIAAGKARPWLARNSGVLDNLRSSLVFVSSTPDAAAEHVRLAIAALPLLVRLSLLDECRRMIELVIARASRSVDARRELTRDVRMRLFAAWGGALLYTRGPTPRVERLWKKALELADRLDNDTFRIRAQWGLAFCALYLGRHDEALGHLRRHNAAARAAGDMLALRDGERIEAAVLHYVGQHARAQRVLEHIIDLDRPDDLDRRLSRFQVDHRAAAWGTLAHVHFVMGRPDSALRHARAAVREAQNLGHAISLGNALVLAAVPVALYRGDYSEAERLLNQLERHVESHGLFIWTAIHHTNCAVLRVLRNERGGLSDLEQAIDEMRRVRFGVRYPIYLGMLAEGLGVSGCIAEGKAAIDAAIAWSVEHNETWSMAELIRIRGALSECEDTRSGTVAAETDYQRALAIAHAQGAAGWGLRASTRLAALWYRTGRSASARELLLPFVTTLSEGFGTRDVKAAVDLLREAAAHRPRVD